MQKKITVLFAFAIFVLLVGWAITPAQAHHRDGHSSGKTAGTMVTTEVQWGGNITGDTARPCVAAQLSQNGDYGSYTCHVGSPKVNYALGAGVQTLRNGDETLCNVFIGIDLTPDSRYGVNWSDNCSDDGRCTIVINNWFSNDHNNQVTTATGGSFIRLRAFADAFTFEPNPFAVPLMLDVDEINLIFYAEGSNKKIAECAYRPDLDNLIVGDVTFQTDPT